MNKKKFILILASISASILSSCTIDNPFAVALSSSSTEVASISEGGTSSVSSSEGNSSVSVNEKALSTLSGEEAVANIETSSVSGYANGRDVFRNFLSNDYYYGYSLNSTSCHASMPSKGNSKMLVVPIYYADSSATSEYKENLRETMYKTFFGEAEETGWESVRSYYYESSYHQLLIEGSVSPSITLPNSYSYYAGSYSSSSRGPSSSSEGVGSDAVVEAVYNSLFGGSDPVYSVSDFDSDSDGMIDGIYLIDSEEINTNLSSGMGWAYTTWHSNGKTSYPALGNYSWSSYAFATEQSSKHAQYSSSTPDAHTYIHETGHQLGLNDYYDSSSTNFNNGSIQVAGGNTMQDYNICDHESFSKYLFGWTSPTVITSSDTESTINVSLNSFESSGDCVVLAGDGYNGTSLDEYLLIEYYTPTGLNLNDAQTTYESLAGIGEAGIKIWHVDKRIYESYIASASGTDYIYISPNGAKEGYQIKADIDASTTKKEFYTNTSSNSFTDYCDITKSPNGTSTYKEDSFVHPELTLLRQGGNTASDIVNTEGATGSDLFKAGETFGTSSDTYSSFTFYKYAADFNYDDYSSVPSSEVSAASKVKLPYSITVNSLGESASLTFTKLS